MDRFIVVVTLPNACYGIQYTKSHTATRSHSIAQRHTHTRTYSDIIKVDKQSKPQNTKVSQFKIKSAYFIGFHLCPQNASNGFRRNIHFTSGETIYRNINTHTQHTHTLISSANDTIYRLAKCNCKLLQQQ